MRKAWILAVGGLMGSWAALATTQNTPEGTTHTSAENVSESVTGNMKITRRTRYRASQSLNFDSQVIQGGVKRPETTVVTGNRDQVTDGLLSLREDFLDHAEADAGVDSGAEE
jgi:hypothetical protein